jgi:hypothetical protein
MLVFINDNFRLDLTYLNVTFTEQNQWFKDDFSTEASFPFDLYLDSELSKNTRFQAHYNANQNQTIFNGYLEKDGEVGQAVLKFLSIKGKIITAVINSGIDNFPSFDKKLSQLNLENKAVADILADANAVILKEYPETNYNFMMVHTDKYDPTSNDWNGFGKIINNYAAGQFLSNELVEGSNVDLIKNIVQPFPYLMHVLKTGIADSGKTLAGDILTDYELNRTLVFRDAEYFQQTKKEEIPIKYQNDDYDSLSYINNGYQYVNFTKEIVIPKKGDYLLFGEMQSIVYSWLPLLDSRKRRSSINILISKIHLGVATEVLRIERWREGTGTRKHASAIVTDNFDLPISFEAGDILRIVKIEPRRDSTPSETPDNPDAISLNLIPQRYRNADGSPIISVLNLNEINLTKVVPDMTFRELIMIVKNLKNYEFIPDGDFIYMNKIQGKLKRELARNIENYDIDEPEREFHEDREFELAFTDGKTNETYKYDSLLISSTAVILNNYVAKPTVNSIKIDALPLPVISRNGVTTAYNFEDQPSKLRLIYKRPTLEGSAPFGFWNENMTIPKLHESDYKDWIDFRINSLAWSWEFVVSVEKFREITIQTLVYAYQNYHVFSEIEKERLNSMYWRITAKTESLI